MKLLTQTFKATAILLFIACLAIVWLAFDVYQFKRKPITLNEAHLFVVEPGVSLGKVAYQLQTQGLIEYPRYLIMLGRWYGQASRIKAGEYVLKPGLTPIELLDKFVSGNVAQYALTVVEGWTFKEMLQAIHRHNKLRHTLKDKNADEIMAQLGQMGEHPEGRFMPETYHFPAGTTDLDFLKRAYGEMENYLQSAWQKREQGLPYKTPYDALIMASIIEKETAVPAERPEIAGVFVRRLQKNMRLQTDPTVIYGMGERFDGNIRRKDLRQDTPYNTYTRHGLTPTPIALPSAEAIDAALHPAKGESLYFVAKGDGSHYFSATLAEHTDAVRKYQLKR